MNYNIKEKYIKLLTEFYYTLPNNAVLIALDFDSENINNNKFYSIDKHYKISANDIENKLSGYSFNNIIIHKENNNIKIEYEYNKNIILKAFDESLLYGIPIYIPNQENKINKALFLDRDGILIEDVGYIGSIDRVIIKKEFINIVKYANEKGYITIVTTNQSGVSYGYYRNEDVIKVHQFIYEEYKKHNAIIDGFYFCPYHIKGTEEKYNISSMLRKPESGMHILASKKYNIDIMNSIMIGDRDSDIIKLPYLKTLLIETPRYKIESRDNIIDINDIYTKLT